MKFDFLLGCCAFIAILAGGFADVCRAGGGDAPALAAAAPLAELRQRLETANLRDVMVVAHRACWHEAPENSIPAIEACIAMGVDMVEIDVHLSADGQLVLLHDETVDRTTDGSGLVGSLTLAQLKELRLRAGQGGADAPFTNHKIPILAEALRALRGRILVNLDAKGETLMPALAEVRRLGMTDHILFKGSDLSDTNLRQFQDVYFMPIVREQNGGLPQQMPQRQVLIPIAYELVYQNPKYLEQYAAVVTADGHRLWVNTMWEGLAAQHTDKAALSDPDAHWGYLVSLGVSMIQTDEPRALLEYLRTRRLR